MGMMNVTLEDHADSKLPGLAISVEFVNGVLIVYADGYGDKCSMPGEGSPLLLELYDGELRVVVWPDINEEDPQIISLAGAKETNYEIQPTT